jgi:hypothetical protein
MARYHGKRRRPHQPVGLDVPTRAAKHGMSGGGQSGEVGHLGPRHEPHGRMGRQTEQVQEPRRGRLLGDRRRRRQGVESRALIPGRRQPLRADGSGERPADHVAEVPAARGGDEAPFGRSRQFGDDPLRVAWGLRKRSTEAAAQFLQAGRGRDRSLGKTVEEPERLTCGVLEQNVPVMSPHRSAPPESVIATPRATVSVPPGWVLYELAAAMWNRVRRSFGSLLR